MDIHLDWPRHLQTANESNQSQEVTVREMTKNSVIPLDEGLHILLIFFLLPSNPVRLDRSNPE
jgi:hypothetical protein